MFCALTCGDKVSYRHVECIYKTSSYLVYTISSNVALYCALLSSRPSGATVVLET